MCMALVTVGRKIDSGIKGLTMVDMSIGKCFISGSPTIDNVVSTSIVMRRAAVKLQHFSEP